MEVFLVAQSPLYGPCPPSKGSTKLGASYLKTEAESASETSCFKIS